jgi:alkanesulfonate monooxygenase SsuD/methylene tetrahydromethanopterin reductase-like flavin-dependent oxidoreductase (luciferase family)
VTFQGQWHHLTDASLSPLPVQRPIPIWLGGFTEATLQRVAQRGDGWVHAPGDLTDPAEYEKVHHQIAFLQNAALAAGRDVQAIVIEAQAGISIRQGGEEAWATQANAWRSLGATHVSVNTGNAGLTSPQAHIDILARLKEILQV